jgi:cytochrome c556
MSSFEVHGAHEVAPYMPKGMQQLGEAMHRAASQFAVATQEAAVENDVGKALAAFAKVTQACVACHAAYRLK